MRSQLAALFGCLLMVLNPAIGLAETGSLRATIPWEGEGQLFRIGPQTTLFLGALRGIVYAETDAGLLNEALILCPVTQRVNLTTGATSGVGQCEVAVDAGDVVYAEFVCEGQVGRCEGEFRLTGGEGRFDGISGSSPISVRAPIQVLATEEASGAEIRIAAGLAELPRLEYRLPD